MSSWCLEFAELELISFGGRCSKVIALGHNVMTVLPPTGVNGLALNRHHFGLSQIFVYFRSLSSCSKSENLPQPAVQREKCGKAHFMAMLEQLRRDFRTGSRKYLKTIFRRLVETWSAPADLESRGCWAQFFGGPPQLKKRAASEKPICDHLGS